MILLAPESADGRETGGILLGRGPDADGVVRVEIAGDAGPRADRRPDFFLRDLSHARELADGAWKRSRAVWVGEWHTHPTGGPEPSATAGDLQPPAICHHTGVRRLRVDHRPARSHVRMGSPASVAVAARTSSEPHFEISIWRVIYRRSVPSVDLRELLLHKQSMLVEQLRASGAFWHPDAKGDVGEVNWHAVLDGRHDRAGFLPGRYAVSSAFIIDADGNTSEQIDLVIHDAHFCPMLFEHAGHRYIPAESVYGVFEVKPELNREYLLYAAEKAASVRALRRTSVSIVHAGGTFEPREPFEIMAGILARDSAWSPPLGDPLVSALGDANPLGRLNLGATAEQGAFEVSYEGEAIEVATSEPDAGLMFFLTRLYTRLQKLGTVTAIDLAEYGRPLEAE